MCVYINVYICLKTDQQKSINIFLLSIFLILIIIIIIIIIINIHIHYPSTPPHCLGSLAWIIMISSYSNYNYILIIVMTDPIRLFSHFLMFNFEDSFFEGLTGGSARHILGFMACRWGWKDQRQGSSGGYPPLVGHGDFYLCNRGVGIPPTSVPSGELT